jgi:hypothetical protein
MSIKTALLHLEKFGLLYLVAFWIFAFGLATYQAVIGGLSWFSAFVETALSDSNTATGWALAMHFLLNAIIAWAAVKIYMASMGLRWDAFAAKTLKRGHVIIVAGRSTTSSSTDPTNDVGKRGLAIELAEAIAPSQKLVLCIPSLDETTRARLWQSGVTVLTDDMPLPAILDSAGIERAQLLITMRDNFEENIALSRDALSSRRTNKALECKCLIEPLAVMHNFQADDYFDAEMLPRIRIFNEGELIARHLLRDCPPDVAIARSDTKSVHLLLFGLGSIGQSVILQLARLGHYRSGEKPKVTVVDQRVGQHWRNLRDAYPAIEQWVRVETVEARIEDIKSADVKKWLYDEYPVTMVYACTSNEVVNLRISRLVLDAFKGDGQKANFVQPQMAAIDPPGGMILSDFSAHADHQDRFRLFSLNPKGLDGFLKDVDDRYARLIHEAYCAEDDLGCAKNPTREKALANRPWKLLPETLRNANRSPADHFDVKLRSLGLALAPKIEAVPAELTKDELELLARMDHNRWWADRALDGWIHAKSRNDERKEHPDMVPYEQLNDDTRQKDRNNVKTVIRILDQEMGMSIVRA